VNADRSAGLVAGTPVDRARLAEVCERYGITELSVFGSVVRDVAGPDSDVDLLYVLASGRHLGFSINRLEDELAELFGRPVDLVSKAALHRVIRDDVLAEAQSLYAA
jgi:predicted nucleotidyltransferase